MAPDTKIIITITRTIPWEALEVANPTENLEAKKPLKSNQMEKLVLRMFLEAPVVKIIDDEEAVFGGIEAQNQAKNQSDYHWANAQAIACDVQADSQTKAPVVKIIDDDEEAVHENLNETQSTKHRLVEVSHENFNETQDMGLDAQLSPKPGHKEPMVTDWPEHPSGKDPKANIEKAVEDPKSEGGPNGGHEPDAGKRDESHKPNQTTPISVQPQRRVAAAPTPWGERRRRWCLQRQGIVPQEEVPQGLAHFALFEAVEAKMPDPLPDQNNNSKDLAEARTTQKTSLRHKGRTSQNNPNKQRTFCSSVPERSKRLSKRCSHRMPVVTLYWCKFRCDTKARKNLP